MRKTEDGNHGSVLPIPLKIHKDGAFFPGLPFIWDRKEAKLYARESQRWKVSITYSITFALVSIYSVRHFSKNHEVVKMVYSYTLLCYCFFGGLLFALIVKNSNEAAAFFNGCRDIEITFARKGIKLNGSSILPVLVKGFLISSRIVPMIYALGAFVMPCFPVNYFAAVLPSCCAMTKNNSNWLLEDSISTLASWISYGISFNAGFTATTHVLVGFLFQISALDGFKRSIESRERHNVMLIYRQLQILNGLFNISHKGVLIYALTGVTVADTAFAYVFVRAPSSALPPMIRVVLFAILVQMVWMQLVVYGYAGGIHAASKAHLREALSIPGLFKDPLARRGLRSCQPLKIVFGESNYFEKNTSQKCFDFSMERFVDLLLMERQGQRHSSA